MQPVYRPTGTTLK